MSGWKRRAEDAERLLAWKRKECAGHYAHKLDLIDQRDRLRAKAAGRAATIRRLMKSRDSWHKCWAMELRRREEAGADMDRRLVLAEARMEKLESVAGCVDAAVRFERDTARKSTDEMRIERNAAYAMRRQLESDLADAGKALARHCFCIFSEDGSGTLVELCDWHMRAIFGRDAGDADLTACPMGPDDDVPIDKVKAELDRVQKRLGRAWWTVRALRSLIVQCYEQGTTACDEVIAESECAAAEGVLSDAGFAGGAGDKTIKISDDPPATQEPDTDVVVDEAAAENEDEPPGLVQCAEWSKCGDDKCRHGEKPHKFQPGCTIGNCGKRVVACTPVEETADPPAARPFAVFAAQVEEAGLTARDYGDVHWQISGGERSVEVWAFEKWGFQMRVAGGVYQSGSVEEAIKLAGKPS